MGLIRRIEFGFFTNKSRKGEIRSRNIEANSRTPSGLSRPTECATISRTSFPAGGVRREGRRRTAGCFWKRCSGGFEPDRRGGIFHRHSATGTAFSFPLGAGKERGFSKAFSRNCPVRSDPGRAQVDGTAVRAHAKASCGMGALIGDKAFDGD